MKAIKKINSLVVALILALFALNSCENTQIESDASAATLTTSILEVDTPMDGITLPIGTKIEARTHSIAIELPESFKFLLFSEKDGVSFSRFGSYSCTCSEQNSCKVFYNSNAGYGCLQNTCTGTCTGKPIGDDQEKLVYGIVNTSSNTLLGDNFVKSGNLTPKGYEIFLEHVAKAALVEFFEFAYASSPYNNGDALISSKGLAGTSQVVLQYMGISFSAVVPNFDSEKDNQLINFQRGPSVSCAGSNGCACTKNRKCILGNCVYYCEGCTTCTITVNEQ